MANETAQTTTTETRGESRALAVIASDASRPHTAGAPQFAGFLAQLIAAKAQCPQTRERRRAEPEEAVVAYQLSLAAVHRTGQTFACKS